MKTAEFTHQVSALERMYISAPNALETEQEMTLLLETLADPIDPFELTDLSMLLDIDFLLALLQEGMQYDDGFGGDCVVFCGILLFKERKWQEVLDHFDPWLESGEMSPRQQFDAYHQCSIAHRLLGNQEQYRQCLDMIFPPSRPLLLMSSH